MNREFGKVLESIANKGLHDQVPGPTDFYDDDGLLVCGVCKQPKQLFKTFPMPTEADPERTTRMKVACMCRCDEEAEKKAEKEKRAKTEMEIVARLRNASLMDSRLSTASFARYEVTPENKEVHKLCMRYVSKFDVMVEKSQGLLLYGDVGTGKSYTAACIANALLKRKIPVIMTSVLRLIDMIQKGESQESVILDRMNTAKLVIFDDFGAERDTEYAIERTYAIIDARYRSKLPMILTTNLSLTDMKNESDIRYRRIYDRILESCYPLMLTGTSFRKRSANQRFEQMKKLLDD